MKLKPKIAARCFIGFDGFTDTIVSAVRKRDNSQHVALYTTIDSFGKKILASAKKSCNIELMVHEKKIGGNAPLLAQALSMGGHEITLAATIGEDQIEDAFIPLAKKCKEVILLGASSTTDALEFTDGKILLGKHDSLHDLTLKKVLEKIGNKRLLDLIDRSDLIVSANWTMLEMTNALWEHILNKITPNLSKKKRYFFVDLADPAKRRDQDLIRALKLLKNLPFETVLGLNLAEAERVASLLKINITLKSRKDAEKAASLIQKSSHITQIVIHSKKYACVATAKKSVSVATYFTSSPKISTGAGDNFNGGFCHGLLLGLSPNECLTLGVATSGFFVREMKSPTMEELAFFLKTMG